MHHGAAFEALMLLTCCLHTTNSKMLTVRLEADAYTIHNGSGMECVSGVGGGGGGGRSLT